MRKRRSIRVRRADGACCDAPIDAPKAQKGAHRARFGYSALAVMWLLLFDRERAAQEIGSVERGRLLNHHKLIHPRECMVVAWSGRSSKAPGATCSRSFKLLAKHANFCRLLKANPASEGPAPSAVCLPTAMLTLRWFRFLRNGSGAASAPHYCSVIKAILSNAG